LIDALLASAAGGKAVRRNLAAGGAHHEFGFTPVVFWRPLPVATLALAGGCGGPALNPP